MGLQKGLRAPRKGQKWHRSYLRTALISACRIDKPSGPFLYPFSLLFVDAINAFTTGNPFKGKLLELSRGRDFGALKG